MKKNFLEPCSKSSKKDFRKLKKKEKRKRNMDKEGQYEAINFRQKVINMLKFFGPGSKALKYTNQDLGEL